MLERVSPWAMAGVIAAIFVLTIIALALVLSDEKERDCEALCSARQSAARSVGAFGCVCHDGTVHGRCE